jgi:choline-glycine betaine transporter
MHFSGWTANHVFRAFALGLLPATLMLFGGLKFMQISLLVVSLSTMVASVVMSEALVKFLKDNT